MRIGKKFIDVRMLPLFIKISVSVCVMCLDSVLLEISQVSSSFAEQF